MQKEQTKNEEEQDNNNQDQKPNQENATANPNQIPNIPKQKHQTYNKLEKHTHIYKIVLIGDAGVGKTHIINRYVKGQLPPTIVPTIGVEFATKTVTLKEGGTIKAQIWDTAGQEKYRSITSAHYRKAVGALLVYDVTKDKSFTSLQKWLEEIRMHADSDIILMLVGNKIDLVEKNPQQRRVSKEEAEQLAKENNLLFEESSALLDININDVFQKLLEEIYDQKTRLNSEPSFIKNKQNNQEYIKSIIDSKNLKDNNQENKDFCNCS